MKKNIYTIICMLFIAHNILSQDFSTKFFIESKSGAKDSIEIGYASNATFGLDTQYDETQIANPLSTTKLQAFIGINNTSSILSSIISDEKMDTYSKKQIVPIQTGYIEMNAVPILIPTDSLPLTIRWDKSLFNNNQRDYSLITDWNIGGWFDAGSHSILEYMKNTNSVQVTQSIKTYQITNNNKTQQFTLLYIAFGNTSNIINEIKSVHTNNDVKLSITNKQLSILNNTNEIITNIKIISASGRNVLNTNSYQHSIDLNKYYQGVYLLEIHTTNRVFNYKLPIN